MWFFAYILGCCFTAAVGNSMTAAAYRARADKDATNPGPVFVWAGRVLFVASIVAFVAVILIWWLQPTLLPGLV